MLVGVNTVEPATRFSGGAPGNSAAVGVRSAIVTYPVALTNLANSSLVNSVLSIQKPSTYTRWMGDASRVMPGILQRDSLSTGLPIENSPPGIQAIPEGVPAGTGAVFGIVAKKADDSADVFDSSDVVLERVVGTASEDHDVFMA